MTDPSLLVALGTTRGELRRQRLRALAASIMGPPVPHQPRVSPLALSKPESQLVLDTLGSERFVDVAPASVHANLLDEGYYLGSVRIMHRLLKTRSGCADRRNQRRRGQLCTVVNPQNSTYRSGKVVQTNRATSL